MKIKLLTSRTDASIGLRLAGVETVLVRTADQAVQAIEELRSQQDTGLLLITAEMENWCSEQLAAIRRQGRPLVTSVPDSKNGFNQSDTISDYIKNAIGIQID